MGHVSKIGYIYYRKSIGVLNKMLNIFFAYSSKDIEFVEEIISIINLPSTQYNLIYFHKYNSNILSMDQIIEKIPAMDVFILLLSVNSLESRYVKLEYSKALKSERIKEICRIAINDIDMKQVYDVLDCNSDNIFVAKTCYSAAEIIKDRIASINHIIEM